MVDALPVRVSALRETHWLVHELPGDLEGLRWKGGREHSDLQAEQRTVMS